MRIKSSTIKGNEPSKVVEDVGVNISSRLCDQRKILDLFNVAIAKKISANFSKMKGDFHVTSDQFSIILTQSGKIFSKRIDVPYPQWNKYKEKLWGINIVKKL